MTRQTVLLLFGGESSEHDVSIMGARNVYAAMDGDKYDVLLGYIDRVGKWWLLDGWMDNLEHHGGLQLIAALGTGSFMTLPGNSIIHPQVILPILHGKNGEDGTIQGLAELLHIPIVGCDSTASAVCMDKVLTKQILELNGIKIVDYIVYRKGSKRPLYADVVTSLGSELFIKPSRSGSSIGVHKVSKEEEFDTSIQDALRYDSTIIIERAINGRELETAVLGTPPKHRVSGIGEIITATDLYDYDSKYSPDSTSQVLTNVELKDTIEASIKDISFRAFEALGCKGIARIDFFLDGKTVYVNEVNTLPGFTNISMYPKLWRAAGMHYPELIDALIADAIK